MDAEHRCPVCHKPLRTGVPQGLCPECLMKAGFGTATGAEQGAPSRRFAPPPVAELAALFPSLEILRLLGQGGMGAVYKARQPVLDRVVALKVLPPDANGPGFTERFTREARALAKLTHPNIVAIFDFGKAGPYHYFVMEYCDGPNLRQLEQAGKLGSPDALRIIPQICEALQFAHNEGIVHRDIKPENILVDKRGQVKIADFGIAKIVGPPGDPSLTGAKDVVGTPHYMAPEQVEKPQSVDHRADIYSLGVVFYEMLTGELPLGKFAPPSQKVQVDVRLDEVVLHTLEKEPERRYQQVSQVKSDVETIGHETSAADTVSVNVERIRRDIKAPAVGLLITGILNWILLPVLTLLLFWVVPREWHTAPLHLSSTALKLACVVSLAMCSLIIFAALRMLRLESYRTAMTGSLLALLVVPGNLIGLPLGLWAFTVLKRPQVRSAFIKLPKDRWDIPAWGAFLAIAFAAVQLFEFGGQILPRRAQSEAVLRRTDASTLNQQGWQLWQSGRPAEAVPNFQRAVQLEPTNSTAWNGLGWASLNVGKVAEAEKAFRKVLELEPDHAAALNGLGQIYLVQKKYVLAEEYLLKASRRAPAAWYGLARIYLLKGDFEQAERWTQNILDSGQADETTHRMLQAARDKKLPESLRLIIEPQ